MHFIAAPFFLIVPVAGAVAVYGVFFAVWTPAIFILRVKRKWRVTFIAVPLVGLLYIGGIVGLFWHNTRPVVVYENAFGVPPSADVSELKSSLYYFADSGEVFLQFDCNRTTLDSLIASKRMVVDPAPEKIWSEPPKWWNPGVVSTGSERYKSEEGSKGFASEESILIYDPQTRQINFYWLGID